MKRWAGLTLVELLVLIGVIALIAGLILPGMARQREESRRLRCRNNLDQLAKGMASYQNEHGDGWRGYSVPLGRCARGSGANIYNGAEWLASLSWVGIIRNPDVFLCPISGDSNADGKDLGSKCVNDVAGGNFGSQTVSYAAMWWKSVNTATGAGLLDDFLAHDPMACDDTQGGINHGTARNGGMNVLFFDSHVEFKTNAELDISTEHGSVGKKPGLLWRLSN